MCNCNEKIPQGWKFDETSAVMFWVLTLRKSPTSANFCTTHVSHYPEVIFGCRMNTALPNNKFSGHWARLTRCLAQIESLQLILLSNAYIQTQAVLQLVKLNVWSNKSCIQKKSSKKRHQEAETCWNNLHPHIPTGEAMLTQLVWPSCARCLEQALA